MHIPCRFLHIKCIFVPMFAYSIHISCIFVAHDCIFEHVFSYLLHMPAWLPAGGFSARATPLPRLARQWQCWSNLQVPNPNHPTQTIPSVQHFDCVPPILSCADSLSSRPLPTPLSQPGSPPRSQLLAGPFRLVLRLHQSHSSWGVPAFS